ncbi:hypothetical protein AL509_29630 [Achromobacter xylosoxidans]|uniref:hypothetical protein n=1 Tax=Alcaligenes xylosoxydans xylosoxydans TaxID=85698 RepID=UPI000CDBE14B|nr:hypothetical protein [Achromobacter xylosoxidans]AUZ19839.1 hypothetical protein AL509_29630 [Achromobacter xylosoxidans]
MQKEIENAIFSNVGNRITQELAMGLVMSLLQVAQQAVEAARSEALSAAASMAPPAAAAQGADEAGAIDPAYARKAEASATRRRATTPTKTTKARR